MTDLHFLPLPGRNFPLFISSIPSTLPLSLRGSQAGLLMCRQDVGGSESLSPFATKPGFQDHYLAKDHGILFSQKLNINPSLLYS